MAAWGPQLGPARVQQVVAYVLTIKDKRLPGKPPQGERVSAPDDIPVGTPAGGAEDVGNRLELRSESHAAITE